MVDFACLAEPKGEVNISTTEGIRFKDRLLLRESVVFTVGEISIENAPIYMTHAHL